MTNKARARRLIGTDPGKWSRQAPIPPPPPWFDDELNELALVVHSTARGDSDGARERLASSRERDEELRDWYTAAIWAGTVRAEILDRPVEGTKVPRDQQDRQLSARGKRQLFESDGHRCRYCGHRIVSPEVLKALMNVLGPESFRATGTDRTRRGAAMAYRGIDDHVVPLSLGGRTTGDNLVTSCYPCNFSKYNFTLQQLQLDDPREREPIIDDWDGLMSTLPALKTRSRSRQR